MKLKFVVASMTVLGLVASPAFASHTKHKHHRMKQQTVANHDYKDMGSMPVMKDAVEVCTISQNSMIMDETTQSIGRSMPNPCNPGWFNRVQLAGGINVDLGKWGNRNTNYQGENYQRFSLNDAYLNIGATVSDWAKAFASISYNTATINEPAGLSGSSVFAPVANQFGFTLPSAINAEYSAAYSNNVRSGSTSAVQLEQAYATLGNFDVSPFYIQVGKQFQDFSRYEIHPITRSMTQVMSETLTTSGKVGFIYQGFNGGLYVFDDPISKVGQTSDTTNYGLALGFDAPGDSFGWDIGAAYLYNLIGANDVAYAVNQFNGGSVYTSGGYNTRAGGVAAYADVNSGPFAIGARYTTAVQRFNPLDLPKNGLADTTNGAVSATASGAKPWAAGITAAYGFEAWEKNQNIYLGYQASREAAGLNLPKSRWLVGYGIDVFGKNTNIGVEWDHDMAYSAGNGGSNNNTNLVSVRSSVKFG